jgi:hypothetical protein
LPPGEFPLRSVVVKPGVTPNTSGPLVANSLLKANVFGVTPGFTTTDLNGNSPGGHTTTESAKIIIKYALSPL